MKWAFLFRIASENISES